MKAELVTTFRFDAAHRLIGAPEGHKCRGMHGHSYRVDVHVYGEVDPQAGWVIDFGQIKKVVAPVIEQLDHKDLGTVEGLNNSTSERIAYWLWERVKPRIPVLSAIEVYESETSRCIYRGE